MFILASKEVGYTSLAIVAQWGHYIRHSLLAHGTSPSLYSTSIFTVHLYYLSTIDWFLSSLNAYAEFICLNMSAQKASLIQISTILQNIWAMAWYYRLLFYESLLHAQNYILM